jgi:uncharacterized RDD family membrane protein YckC
MKCEKCACVLPGSRVNCPQCGFNNAAQRADKWKAQRQASLATESNPVEALPTTAAEAPAVPGTASAAAAAKVRARYASEAKLLQFPVTPKVETEAPRETAPSEPAWRELARAKVREHQQRRQSNEDGNGPIPTPEDPTAQLIVESALKRIRRVQPPPTVRPLPRIPRHTGGQAVARALDYDEQLLAGQLAQAPEAPIPAPLAAAPPLRQASPSAQPAVPSLRQATPAALRTRLDRLETSVPKTEAIEAAPAPVPVSVVEEPSITPSRIAAEGDEVLTPALAALEQRATETNTSTATTGKKSHLWVGKPAPIWLRALAGAVDLEAAALAYLPFFGAYTSLDGPPEWADLYLMVSILAVVLFLYQLITYSFNGRTFGMALCGLRCVDATDASTQISFNRRLWQALGGTIGLLCPPFNFVVTRLTEYQRGLADALGNTITLRRAED